MYFYNEMWRVTGSMKHRQPTKVKVPIPANFGNIKNKNVYAKI